MRILVTRKIHISAIKLLKEKGLEVISFDVNKPLDPKYLTDNINKFDGVLTCVSERIDRNILLKTNGRLRVISNMAVGLDNIDVEFAKSLGIKVFNTPGVVTAPTADMTIGLAFTLLRKIREADHFVRQGSWKAWDPEIFLGRNFSSLVWGIIGYGNIGKAVAKRLAGFGMKILFYDPVASQDDSIACSAGIDELLKQSDVISLHLPLNRETRDFLDNSRFGLMKNSTIIINMARGGVINSDALLEALKNHTVAGAALDVFDPEPIPSDHEILSLDNVILTPHIGTATIECRREMAELAAINIINNI